ncbi:TIGR04222 domain-containing membrane protein [Streptomyces qinzhouensis]|uniref:TIGR04222 domain-containing membrane protein n=1 Tax=Streptomyces qinzhouensis TaxID=2599401 RepID=A0A5B8JIA4_9ACTN|nr:TIGR04222 domain-containing membrane protein [Streptomyces qinzhouensis]QDY79581.1 TIGR04222 domain-containing membrane protein [Streptomyces qinzhouensis]
MDPQVIGIAAMLIVVALVVALAIATNATRPRPRDGKSRGLGIVDTYEAAFLRGGPLRVADAVIAHLHDKKHLAVARPGIVSVLRGGARDTVPKVALDLARDADNSVLSTLRRAVAFSPTVQGMGDRLYEQGLLAPPSAARRAVHRWAMVQLVVLFIAVPASFGLTLFLAVSDDPGAVVFLLPVVVIGAIVTGRCGGLTRGRLTTEGRNTLKAYVRDHRVDGRVAVKVAVRGPRQIPDTTVRELMIAAAAIPLTTHLMYSTTDGSSTASFVPTWCGSADGGGGGDSGCGGGGCGGGSGGGCGGGGGGGGGCGGGGGGGGCGGGGG